VNLALQPTHVLTAIIADVLYHPTKQQHPAYFLVGILKMGLQKEARELRLRDSLTSGHIPIAP
jgi:hypothetical protein